MAAEKNEQKKYLRFCRVCKRQTYEWRCCGQRTSRVNLQSRIGDKAIIIDKAKAKVLT